MCSHWDSNPNLLLRRRLFYPVELCKQKKLRLNGESCTRDESRTHTHVMHYDLNVACLPISAPGYSLQIYKFILSFQMTLQILGSLIWSVMTPTRRIKYILQFISKFLSSLYVMPYILILVSSNH